MRCARRPASKSPPCWLRRPCRSTSGTTPRWTAVRSRAAPRRCWPGAGASVRVLVTGASSLLGGAVACRLQARGDDVTAQGCRQLLGDVTDAAAVRQAAHGQDAVVHLAARVSVTGPWAAFEEVNVDCTANMVAGARAAGVARLVHVSSPSVAHSGRALVGAGAEPADPVGASGHYARSKALAEQLALASDGPALAVVAVRPHLVWGPGDTQMVGRIVQRARAGRLALVGDGAALIDSTYVDDAAAALVAARGGRGAR